jgi:hypothetical protein
MLSDELCSLVTVEQVQKCMCLECVGHLLDIVGTYYCHFIQSSALCSWPKCLHSSEGWRF